MRILVLGGTVFLSRAVAEEALRRGHEVVCACRGESGSVPDGASLVRWDRAAGEPAPDVEADAVVDVARHPSWVRTAVAAWPGAHWVFVSSISVYADNGVPGQSAETGATLDALDEDRDPREAPEVYGGMKVACEQVVRDGAASALVVRPGLIVGPGDPTGRFPYWPERLADAAAGAPVLAPGSPDDVTQVVDVRDLASWCLDLAEQRTVGTWDAIGPPTAIGELLAEVARGVGTAPELVWVPSDVLAEHDVEPWTGERGVPLWLPRPEYDGMTAHDHAPAAAAGLASRPVADVARDTLAWLRATPDAVRTGLSREAEAEVLAALD